MPSAGDDAARLRSLLDIASAAASSRAVDDLVRRVTSEAKLALDATSVTVEVAPEPAASRVLTGRLLSVPIMVDGRLWGRLSASRSADQTAFGPEDLDFITAVAAQVAAGVSQAEHVARIERLAFEDALTGLANRRAVDDRLEESFVGLGSDGHSVAVILADINRLKQINDSLGHGAGDRLICSVADAVRRAAATVPRALPARIGGDEFCVVVSGVAHAEVVALAQRLCQLVDELPMSTGVSCGVASTALPDAEVASPARLLRLADAAQYRAKRAGARGPVVAGSAMPVELDGLAFDRRSARSRTGRLGAVLPAALGAGMDLLDLMPEATVQERVEAVAGQLSELADAAGWWLSVADLRAGLLTTVSSSVARSAGPLDERSVEYSAVGTIFDLAHYPASERAVRAASSFSVEIGSPGNDPAEETGLLIAGYESVVAAGAAIGDRGWLVELFADTISLPVVEFEHILRALVAVAVGGARPRATAGEAAPPAPRSSAAPG